MMDAQRPSGGDRGAEVATWLQNHAELDRLATDLLRRLELERPPGEETRGAMNRFATGLEAHFSVEERVYFPAVEREYPRCGPALDRARHAHDVIRKVLHEIRLRLEEADSARAHRSFQYLLQRFRAHEEDEDRLIDQLG